MVGLHIIKQKMLRVGRKGKRIQSEKRIAEKNPEPGKNHDSQILDWESENVRRYEPESSFFILEFAIM